MFFSLGEIRTRVKAKGYSKHFTVLEEMDPPFTGRGTWAWHGLAGSRDSADFSRPLSPHSPTACAQPNVRVFMRIFVQYKTT